MAQFRWRAGRSFRVDAQTAGEELDRLQRRFGGKLTPRIVVDDARPVGSVLHDVFEWDDVRASELHREQQARQLIGAVRVVRIESDQVKPTLQRAFVNIRPLADEGQSYRPLVHVLADVELRQQLLAQARTDMRIFMRRYSEFSELVEAATQVLEQIDYISDRPAIPAPPG